METIQQYVQRIGELQVAGFKDFQDKNFTNGTTIRDFDAWLSGFMAGVSNWIIQSDSSLKEEDIKTICKDVSQKISEGATAKSLGIKGLDREDIVAVRIEKLKY